MSAAIVDKHGALTRERPLKLDLGCGTAKRDASFVGVDVLDSAAVDIVGDLHDVLGALEEGSVCEIHASHLLEHLTDLPAVVDELARVLVVGGRLHVVVPHFSNPYFHSDPTHRQPFGLYTFSYLAEDPILRRRVPTYGHAIRLRLESIRLGFRSASEFGRVRNRLKQAFGQLANASTWTQELYEATLTGIVPCYELELKLVKVR